MFNYFFDCSQCNMICQFGKKSSFPSNNNNRESIRSYYLLIDLIHNVYCCDSKPIHSNLKKNIENIEDLRLGSFVNTFIILTSFSTPILWTFTCIRGYTNASIETWRIAFGLITIFATPSFAANLFVWQLNIGAGYIKAISPF